VAEDEVARRHMSTTLHKFYDAHGDASDKLAHGQRRGNGLTAAGPSQVQQSPLANQGYGGRGQGSHALSYNARGRRAQQADGDGRPRQVPVPSPGLGSQAR
jgi:hypothetical protein